MVKDIVVEKVVEEKEVVKNVCTNAMLQYNVLVIMFQFFTRIKQKNTNTSFC
mgnify:CR=1|jgi:hypothetical protein